MSDTDELVHSAQQHLYPNYRQPPLIMDHGQGCELRDKSGKRYLDLYAGIAVSTLGHAHPKLVQAIAEQAGKLLHTSNYFYNEPNVRLAEKLCALSKMGRAFFCSSGAEANEAMLKLARRHFHAQGETDRYRVIAFKSSFHGRTMGALAVTGQDKYRDGFGPLPGVTHVAYGDAAAVRAAMGPDVAAILVEPVQGEGGVVPAPDGFLAELRGIADERDALLLLDEVQTGIGRTGRFLACEHAGVKPDAVALAKALGGGVPIGAMLCREKLSGALPPGSHGSTFGGNPLASAAALCVLETIESEGLVEAAARKGEHLAARLADLAARHERHVEASRGQGLLQALALRESVDARALLGKLRDAGVLLTIAGRHALRFSPPLVVTEAELDEGVAVVDRTLGEL
jgi:acetylornithine/N-succinyldiaminopimelate aminotransferase